MKFTNSARLLLLATVVAVAASSCITGNARLKGVAEVLSKLADECLYDVRDRNLSYEAAPNCSALGVVAMAYIEAGGFRDEPANIRIIAERARATAWMARTVSLPGGKGLSIW